MKGDTESWEVDASLALRVPEEQRDPAPLPPEHRETPGAAPTFLLLVGQM